MIKNHFRVVGIVAAAFLIGAYATANTTQNITEQLRASPQSNILVDEARPRIHTRFLADEQKPRIHVRFFAEELTPRIHG